MRSSGLSFSVVTAAILLTVSSSRADDPPRLAVMPLQALNVEPHVARILGDILTVELDRRGGFQVLSETEINAMLDMERIKETLGCDDVTCAAEIGGALGADSMIAGSVGRLGTRINIKLTLFDLKNSNVRKRVLEEVDDQEDLFKPAILAALAELFDDVPADPPPSPAAPTTPADPPAPEPSTERFFLTVKVAEGWAMGDLEGRSPINLNLGGGLRIGPLRGGLAYGVDVESGDYYQEQFLVGDLHLDLDVLYLRGGLSLLIDDETPVGLLGGLGKSLVLGHGFYLDGELTGTWWPTYGYFILEGRLGFRWAFSLLF